MAITKTFARAPCPLFTGRGLDNEGFTIKMPYKTYLTCQKENIASERSLLTVFNYDLAEYVYTQTADAYAFGVYVETGGYTDAITDAKHMYAAKFFLKLSEAYSLGAGERQNADVRAVSIGLEVAYDLSGVAHGAYISAQFKEDADGVTIGGYYLANTQTYGVIGLEVRTEAKDNGDGGITVGAAAYGVVGLLVAQKNDAAFTGNYAAIVLHLPYEGSDAIVGTTFGIRFDDAGLWTGTDFDIGIDFGDQCVIAIDIGECTTGITFSGTVGKAIQIAAGATTTTGISIEDACATAAITLSGANALGLNITGANTTAAIQISAGTTIGLHILTTVQADGILIAGACTDGIHISGACATYAINISGTLTTGIVISSAAANGILISGACTDSIEISGDSTYAINISSGCSPTTAILINGDTAIAIDFTAEATLGYILVGDNDGALMDSGAVAAGAVWAGLGIFTTITGAGGRISGWKEDHGVNIVLHEDGEVMFMFGGQFRSYIDATGQGIEVMGVSGRARVAASGTIGNGTGQLIGCYGEADMVSGGIINIGGSGIVAGVRAIFDDNGATWTTYGKRAAISAEWEDGTADCVIYVLKHAGAEAGGHGIEFNDPGTDATDLLKITSPTGWGTNVASFVTQSNDAAASLKIDINGTPYYIACYSAHHSS